MEMINYDGDQAAVGLVNKDGDGVDREMEQVVGRHARDDDAHGVVVFLE